MGLGRKGFWGGGKPFSPCRLRAVEAVFATVAYALPNATVARAVGLSERQSRRVLAALVASGALDVCAGSEGRRGTMYRRSATFVATPARRDLFTRRRGGAEERA